MTRLPDYALTPPELPAKVERIIEQATDYANEQTEQVPSAVAEALWALYPDWAQRVADRLADERQAELMRDVERAA